MMNQARAMQSAEEWQVKYEVVVRYIDNPAVIANAERAAQWVLDTAVSSPYTLAEVTEMFKAILHAVWANEQATRPAQQPSAAEIVEQLRRAAQGQ